MNSGVYEILNSENGERYVGSTVNFRARWRDHRAALRRGVHPAQRMQRAWTECEARFEFRKLLICSTENLLMYEQMAIDVLNPEYNSCKNAGNCLGRKLSAETRAKIGASKVGNSYSLGYKHTDLARSKMRQERLGAKASAEARLKMSLSHTGKAVAQSTRKKISASLVGNCRALGNELSRETRERMSAGQRRRWAATRTRLI